MSKLLTHNDIREILTGFAAAIQLDQIHVDALPPERFHHFYDPGMWRQWRRDHLDYMNKRLLPTLEPMPSDLLRELTEIALTYEPMAVRESLLELFAHAVVEDAEHLETATLFFQDLIRTINHLDPEKAKAPNADTRACILKWLSSTDPLRISEDPECCYGRPAGVVN
jgi:hypothetical protein